MVFYHSIWAHNQSICEQSLSVSVFDVPAASESQVDDGQQTIERYIMSRIYTHAMFPNGDGDILRDQWVVLLLLIGH